MLRTALHHLITFGYARMSVNAIATELGISKPSIYLRWASKGDLAAAALSRFHSRADFPPDLTGDTHRDLLNHLEALRQLFESGGIRLTGTLWAEELQNPKLIATFRKQLIYPNRDRLRHILHEGIKRGEIRADADIDAAVHMMAGSLYAAHLSGDQAGLDMAAIVRTLLLGLSDKSAPPASKRQREVITSGSSR